MLDRGENPDRVPEESVEPILARAAELDRRARETVPVDMVRSAAVEAGIGLDAVNRAVQEYSAGVGQAAPSAGALENPFDPADVRRAPLLRLFVLAAAAAGIAAAVAAAGHNNLRLAGMFVIAAVGAALVGRIAIKQRGRGRLPFDREDDSPQ